MKKTYTKLMALAGALGLAFGASAQISGVVTVNSAMATGGTNYQSFSALATDLNTNGVNGPLTVNVVAASGPYIEQPMFTVISGANASNRIIINGNGNTLQFNSSNFAMPWTLCLNGTDYMTVNNLTMIGQGTTYAMVCVLTGGADQNRFNNCRFECPVNGTSSYQIPFSLSSSNQFPGGGTNSGNYNTVTTCTMANGYYGIFNYGLTGAPYQQSNSFIGNWVTDFYQYGVYYPYQMNCTLKNNTIDRLTRTTSSTIYGLAGWYNQGAMVDGNKIYKLYNGQPNATSQCLPMYVYYCSQSGGLRNTYRNNIISSINTSGTIYGIYNYYGNSDTYHNTIDLDYASNQSGTIYGMYPYAGVGYNNTITNNIITIRRPGSGTRYGVYIALTGNITMDRNNIVHTPSVASSYMGFYTSAATTLGAWNGQIDNSALSIDPQYLNPGIGDLHPTNAAMDNTAIPISLVFDQEQAVRNQATPDVGALEFLTPSCAGTPSANTVNAPTFAICPGEDVTMSLGFLNPASGFTYQWNVSTVSNVGPFTPVSGATGLFYTAPSVTANTWYQIVQTCTLPGGSAISPVGAIVVAGPSQSVIPYYEDFEGIGMANRLPNCSWMATGMGSQNKTYISSNSGNRVPRNGTSFATFDINGGPGTSAYYTNPITMNAGITYSAAVHYATEYFGYGNWTNLSIWVGPNQSTVGLVQVASISPAISGPYKLLDGLFTVPSSGLYHVAIRATGTSGSAMYLSIDDISVTIPCYEGGPNTPTVTANASSTLICAGDAVNLTAAGAASYNWSSGATGAAIVEYPLVNTTYTVLGMDAVSGCEGAATVKVDVMPAPMVFAVANPPVVCAGQNAILSAISPGSTFNWSTGGSGANITVNPTSATNYIVIATGMNGCSSSFTQAVGVLPSPTITVISSNPVEACKDDVLTLTANGGASYQWISNVSPNVYQGNPINITSPASGVFTVTAIGANGCPGKSTLSQNISDCTGIKSAGSLSGVQVYPNPTSGMLTVAFGNNAEHTVNVTDVTGRVIISNNSNNADVNVDLSNLASGIYYVKLQSENAVNVVKVVKQ